MFERREATEPEVEEFVGRLDGDLSHFKEFALRSSEDGAWIDIDSGALLIGHTPERGPAAFEIVLYPPLARERLEKLSSDILRELLSRFNGANFRELSIYGKLSSFTRSARQPLSLDEAKDSWFLEYDGYQPREVLFASQNVTWEGQVGYFIKPTGEIVGRGNGNDVPERFLQTWASINDWSGSVLNADRVSHK